ncbi:MAG: CCA tRNA nucleotidyltransferase [Firmicutes bacterium]|nr:CCA tRNA nucleotidyltransferase [Bacillota bacterium]
MSLYVKTGNKVLSILTGHGHFAYFVGGFVRDFLLGLPVNDIDITTDASPKLVKSYFKKTRDTGIKYGTITVFEDDFAFEVTTFRSEGVYSNHRHPKQITFSKTIEEDLKRRDFTINALAMDQEKQIIDLFDGKRDLKLKLIRAIGNPDTRFYEDALRMLRAFRFISKLDFDIEEKTFQSIEKNYSLLSKISNERILQEFRKIIEYPFALKALQWMNKSLVKENFPDLLQGINFLSKQTKIDLNILEFFALCFYLNGMEISDKWRFSNKDKAIINRMIELVEVTKNDSFNELIVYSNGLDLCLMANKVNASLNPQNNQEAFILSLYNKMPIHQTCDLAFKGQDILELTSLKDARIIGDIIDELTYKVITLEIPNDYDTLKELALHFIQMQKDRTE